MPRFWGMFALTAAVLAAEAEAEATAAARSPSIRYDCDNCIDRSRHKIKAILHGTSSDGFWQQVSSAMIQAGKDMRIHLDLQLYDAFHEEKMVSDIEKATEDFIQDHRRTKRKDTPLNTILVVTIPSPKVKAAVSKSIHAGMPVFGVNSGYQFAKELPALGYVAMDDYMAGQNAAREFVSKTNVTTALYINHAKGNVGLEQRRLGFAQTLRDHDHNRTRRERFITNADEQIHSDIRVDELVIDMTQNAVDIQSHLNHALEGCTYDVILLAGAGLLEHATSAYYHNSCKFDGNQLLGSFDTDSNVYDAIASGKLEFTISQQQYLQGAFAIVLAAIYSTTGQHLAPSGGSSFGAYLAGPKVIKLTNLPTDTQQRCEAEAFPICSSNAANNLISKRPNRAKCDCIDRRDIKIGGVLYGPKFAPFWRPLWAAAEQAALDVDVELRLDSLEGADEHFKDGTGKVGQKIISLCQEGVDGIFTPIKSHDVVEAIKFCHNLSVPVLSLNSGADSSQELGTIQHISQIEYRGGFVAGERMAAAGLKVGYCVNWGPTNDLDDRCFGFRDAILAANVNATYGGVLALPSDNVVAFKSRVETNMTHPDDWAGVGFLLAGFDFLEGALFLKQDHPQLLLGTFDVNNKVYEAIDNGDLLFGIDQQPYLQGYLPITLLAWFAYTNQSLVHHHFMETGPHLVEAAASKEQKTCETNFFKVCPQPNQYHKHQLDKVRPVGLAVASIIFLCSVLFAVWVAVHREERVVKVSQPIFLLLICTGTITMAGSIIPMSLDDGVLRDDGGCLNCECKQCDVACMAAPWLLSMGFSLIFASLFSKIWRVNKLQKNSSNFRRITVSAPDVALPLFVLLALDVSIMLVWTFLDPMYWQRTQRCGSDQFTSYGSCILGRGPIALSCAVSVSAVNVVAVIVANFEAMKAREIYTAYSESGYIAMAMASILQVILVGVPLLFLVKDNPPAMFFMQTGIVGVICMSVLLFIFVPKMNAVRLKGTPERFSCDISSSGLTSADLSFFLRRRLSFSSLADLQHRMEILQEAMKIHEDRASCEGVGPAQKDGQLSSSLERAEESGDSRHESVSACEGT